jgi:hypothetical protein
VIHTRWRTSAVVAVAACLLVGCGSTTSGPGAQASPTLAEQWFAARASAGRQGVENLVRFYDPAVVLDHRALGFDPIAGRTEALEHFNRLADTFQDSRTPAGPLYLSTDGALTTENVATGRQGCQLDAVVHTAMGPSGAVSETIAASLVSWRTHFAQDARVVTAQALAQQYARAWSQEDSELALALYEPDAVVTDSLAGVTVRRSAQIADLAVAPAPAGGPGATSIDQLPDFRGPAIFVAGRPLTDVPFDTIALLMTVGPSDSCPHRVAALLHLGPDGLIRAEERLHRVDDLQRCHGALPPGWWDSTVIPDPVLVERTGTLTVGDLEIEVYNGTPGLEDLITWSFAQFETHGLGTPIVHRVTFHNRQIDKCEAVTGLILGDAVTLCFDATRGCQDLACTIWPTWARRTTLHELAHAWMDEHLSTETIEEFQAATGMPTWADSKHPWGHRGVELAAETIAWATSDEPAQVNSKLGTRTCDELTRYYRILTGRQPRWSCCCSSDSRCRC